LDGDMHHHAPQFGFCPVCGGRLSPRQVKEGEPLRLVCGACEFVFYLDPKVVACVILERRGKIALLRRSIEPRKGKWVMPGGYVDREESVIAAARRETLEECGLEVSIGDLAGVYSYPGNLAVVIVYKAAYQGGNLAPADEVSEGGWFAQSDIPWEDLAFQSTTDALREYYRRKQTQQ
jgi:ADP-ribose pyrophosphatase YjhB (NUDIX family)